MTFQGYCLGQKSVSAVEEDSERMRVVDVRWRAAAEQVKLLEVAQNSQGKVPHPRNDSRNNPNNHLPQEDIEGEQWEVIQLLSHRWMAKTTEKVVDQMVAFVNH